jgi:F-type H+-transporting ATPase subunit epsilon
MAEQLQLRVVTPKQAVVDEAVDEVTGPGTVGEFGVLPNHATFLSTLEIGALSYKAGAGVKHLAVRGGFAEVVDNVMTVLADAAVPAEDIDAAAAESELAAATQKLAELDPLEPDYAAADADRRWAETRIDLVKAR